MDKQFDLSWRRRILSPAALVVAGAFLVPAAAHAQITYISSFGSEGTGAGQFDNPSGVAVGPDGTVYVADPNDSRIQYFTPTGTYLGVFGASGAGAVNQPNGLAVGANGTVYVPDASNRVLVYNSTGAFQGTFGSAGSIAGDFSDPTDAAFGPNGTLYVTDAGNNRIEQFTAAGAFLSTFGSLGSAAGLLNHPLGVAVGPTGTVYVSDSDNSRINAYSATGIFQNSFGSAGSASGELSSPDGIAVSATGTVYVADYGNDRIDTFNSAGSFLGSVGAAGSAAGDFFGPSDIAVTANGAIYVVNTGNNRIDRFFDPSAWVAGANSFNNLTSGPVVANVGPTGILGTSLTLNPAMSLSALELTVEAGGLLTQAGGGLAISSMGVAGNFIYQSGAFTATTLNVVTGGTFQAIQGGALTVSTSATITGQMTLDGGTALTAPAATVSSGGLLSIGNSMVTLTGALTNSAGGEVQLTNTSGSILRAASIQNSGLLDGTGRIDTAVINNATGNVSVNSGQSLTISGAGNTNAGFINLGGGSLHYTQALSNTGTIEGFGSLRVDGGLTNTGGTLALAGSSSITGVVTSNSASLIHLSGNTPNVFFSAVSNSGSLAIDAGASGTFYGPYTGGGPITDNGSLYLNANSVAGTISGNGNLTIGSVSSGPAVVLLNADSGGSTLSSLTITSGSTFDINNNHVFINYGSGPDPISSIASMIASGYAGGSWTGDGITSTAAKATSGAYGIGYADSADAGNSARLSADQIELKYTLLGDANLDGVVNGDDFTILAGNLGKAASGWDKGDFNYDGVDNGDDFTLLVGNLGKQTNGAAVALPASDYAAIDAFAAANGLMADVPEPGALTLLALGAMGALVRRRRDIQPE